VTAGEDVDRIGRRPALEGTDEVVEELGVAGVRVPAQLVEAPVRVVDDRPVPAVVADVDEPRELVPGLLGVGEAAD